MSPGVDIIRQIKDSLRKLYSIWDEIGLISEVKAQRTNVVVSHIQGLLQEMVDEETALKERLTNNSKEFAHEVDQLTKELSLPKYEVQLKNFNSLF